MEQCLTNTPLYIRIQSPIDHQRVFPNKSCTDSPAVHRWQTRATFIKLKVEATVEIVKHLRDPETLPCPQMDTSACWRPFVYIINSFPKNPENCPALRRTMTYLPLSNVGSSPTCYLSHEKRSTQRYPTIDTLMSTIVLSWVPLDVLELPRQRHTCATIFCLFLSLASVKQRVVLSR